MPDTHRRPMCKGSSTAYIGIATKHCKRRAHDCLSECKWGRRRIRKRKDIIEQLDRRLAELREPDA